MTDDIIEIKPGWMWEAHGADGVIAALQDQDKADRYLRQESRQEALRKVVVVVVSALLSALAIFCLHHTGALISYGCDALRHPGAIILTLAVLAIIWCALPRNYE